MKIFNLRLLSGPSLDRVIKKHNRAYISQINRKDFYHNFFTRKEKKFLHSVYMTVYQNQKGMQYVRFTNHLPSPSGKLYTNMDSLIGATTGYNTEIISCEKCYIIG